MAEISTTSFGVGRYDNFLKTSTTSSFEEKEYEYYDCFSDTSITSSSETEYEYYDCFCETSSNSSEESEYLQNLFETSSETNTSLEEYNYLENLIETSSTSSEKEYEYHDNSFETSISPLEEKEYEEEYEDHGNSSTNYVCLPLSEINKSHLECGNRIIMPPSALDELMQTQEIDESPMTFEITNLECGKVSHCGVLEFSGEEGFVYLPNWMMDNMTLKQGELISIKSTSLQKATYMKIQPHKNEFVTKLSNPKIVLENILRDFVCLTVGDTITLNYGGNHKIDIVDLKPDNAVSLFETDCEVDFAQSLDYKEPEKIKAEETNNFKPFTGVSRRLDGKISTTNPSAVKLNVADRATKAKEEDVKGNVEGKKFQPFTGQKYTLSGNSR